MRATNGRVPQVPRFWGPGKLYPWSRLTGPAIILLAAFVAVAPQLIRGNSCGHDFDFHLVSWFDCLNAWKHGLFYPHWTPSANYGAGEPRFLFYPPLTWMLGAALGLILPWRFVPVAMTFLLLAATGLATRALARHALSALSDAAATLAGCLALFSGYALFTAYERSAFGEMTGGFWLPLLLLFALRDRDSSAPPFRRALNGSALPLTLLIAGAWLSNLPVGVMACYLLAAVALVAAALAKSWAPILRATVAAILGTGLAALYLVPAAIQQRWVDVRQAVDDPGLKVENGWLFAHHADPTLALHDVELARVSSIAVAMLALALAGLFVSWRRGRLSRELSFSVPLALVPFAILFLLLPVSQPVWHLLPKLDFLQFPWRWLVALEAPMAIFVAAAIWPHARRWRIAVASLCAAVFLSSTIFAANSFFQVCDDEDAVAPMLTVYRTGAGFAGYGEFAPPDADNALIPAGLPAACLVSDPSVTLGKIDDDQNLTWSPSQGTCEAVFHVAGSGSVSPAEFLRIRALNIPHAGYLVLRLRSYPAWRITVNGQPPDSLAQRDDGLIAVPVPQGPLDLTVDWTTTPDAVAGRWLTALSVLLLTALCLWERKLRQTGPNPGKPRLS